MIKFSKINNKPLFLIERLSNKKTKKRYDLTSEDKFLQVCYLNLKKGDKVLTSHLGFPIEAELLEKPRNHVTLVMLTNADKFGLFNEHGSVHTKQLKSPKVHHGR